MDSLKKIKNVIDNSSTIVLAGHTNPDGDAIGACLGAGLLFKNQGKKVFVVLEEFAEKYQCFCGLELVKKPEEEIPNPDVFLSLDCGDKDRLPKEAQVFMEKAGVAINIDHHKNNTLFCQFNYVEEEASSACELVYKLSLEGYPLTKEAAKNLYGGIVYDTGGFRHSSTSPFTMRAAANLMEYSFDYTAVYNTLQSEKTFSETKLLGIALEKMNHFAKEKGVYTFITREDIKKAGGSDKELDSIVNVLKNIKGTAMAVFFYEKREHLVKVSFRSESVDVCLFAGLFGGGGHQKAAGCSVEGNINHVMKTVLEKAEAAMEQA